RYRFITEVKHKGATMCGEPEQEDMNNEDMAARDGPRADGLELARCTGRRTDAHERGGGDVPVPDLLQVVRRIHEGRSGSALQLSVDRQRRRHQADLVAHGRLRGYRRPDDGRAAQAGAE